MRTLEWFCKWRFSSKPERLDLYSMEKLVEGSRLNLLSFLSFTTKARNYWILYVMQSFFYYILNFQEQSVYILLF